MTILASILIAAATATATPVTRPVPTPTPAPAPIETTANLGGWWLIPFDVFTFEDEDCAYSIFYVTATNGQIVIIHSEATCTDVAPDEESDW